MVDIQPKIESKQELLDAVHSYNPIADVNLISKAYDFAEKSLSGKKRISGVEYFKHCLAVTEILVKMKAGSTTIAAALLHHVFIDPKIHKETIKNEFNEEVLSLVEGITKITDLNLDKQTIRAENIRKVVLATTKDIRVILIKLADRLHNMRTIDFISREKQKQVSQEVLEIYAPIAHKLGLNLIKTELQDSALKTMYPVEYAKIKEKVNQKKDQREREMEELVNALRDKLRNIDVDCIIYGRIKSFYSIYKKIYVRKRTFEEIHDLIALRVIVNTVDECYKVLGYVHKLWVPIPTRLKDFIANPKSNGYQSIHTNLLSESGNTFEVQIRTHKMHIDAEEGVAAHWRYKGMEKDKLFDKKIAWLKEILEWKHDTMDAHDFIDSLKVDLFTDEICVFTPKGDPVTLPDGATPIDFAYSIHTLVGAKCSKVKVNGKLVSLDTKLHSGDIVDIVTSQNTKPSRNWLKFCVTNSAKAKIRKSIGLLLDPKKEENKELDLDLIAKIDYPKKSILKLARCCKINLYDPIIGLKTKEGKISIHSNECSNLKELPQDKRISLSWIKTDSNKVNIVVSVKDKPGILGEILNLIANRDFMLYSVNTKAKKDHSICYFGISAESDNKIKSLIEKIRSLDNVISVEVV